MVLIFSTPCCSASSSKDEKIRLSIAKTCCGERPSAILVKLTMSTNITVTSAKPGDGLFVMFEALGDRAGQDVEEQALGALLFFQQQLVSRFQTGLGLGFLLYGVAQQDIDNAGNGGEVQGEEEDAGPGCHLGHRGSHAVRQEIVEETGEGCQENIGDEPGDRFAGAEEKYGPDRSQQAPQAGAAGRNEVADAPLHREGREKEKGELRIAEEIEIAATEEKQQVADQKD